MMAINFKRRLFRIWPALPLAWISLAGWKECVSKPKARAWSAESIPAWNQWRQTIVQRLAECGAAAEAANPIAQWISQTTTRVWESLEDSLRVILLPPVALLIIGWTIRGFRAGG
jgi:hypothetical protein